MNWLITPFDCSSPAPVQKAMPSLDTWVSRGNYGVRSWILVFTKDTRNSLKLTREYGVDVLHYILRTLQR